MSRLASYLTSKRRLADQIAKLKATVAAKDEELKWLREQIDGYRNAFQSLETQYLLEGAKAKAYIRGIQEREAA